VTQVKIAAVWYTLGFIALGTILYALARRRATPVDGTPVEGEI
jgi:hypothetical protein